jgi:hypothetical protein
MRASRSFTVNRSLANRTLVASKLFADESTFSVVLAKYV